MIRDTELDISRQNLFEKLRPLSLALLNPKCWSHTSKDRSNPVVALYQTLQNVSESTDIDRYAEMIAPLIEYITFPILSCLHSSSQSSQIVKEYSLLILKGLIPFSAENVFHLRGFTDLIMTLNEVLAHHSPLKDATDEAMIILLVDILISVMKIQTVLGDTHIQLDAQFMTIPTKILFTTSKMFPLVGKTISSLVDIVKSKTYSKTREQALIIMFELVSKLQNADRLAVILPGVFSACMHVILSNDKENHKVIIKSLVLMRLLIALVLNDDKCKKILEPRTENSYTSSKKQDSIKSLPPRNQDWLCSSQKRIEMLVQNLDSLAFQSNAQVRQSFFSLHYELLKNCRQSLHNCIPHSLDLLMISISDQDKCVTEESCSTWSYLSGSYIFLPEEKESKITFKEIVSQNLENSITKLVSSSKNDDQVHLYLMRLMIGGLIILKDEAKWIISKYNESLSKILLSLLEIDYEDVRIMEEGAMTRFFRAPWASSARLLGFKHIHQDSVFENLVMLSSLIGKYGDLEHLVNILIPKLQEGSSEAVLLLNELCQPEAALNLLRLNTNGHNDNMNQELKLQSHYHQVAEIYINTLQTISTSSSNNSNFTSTPDLGLTLPQQQHQRRTIFQSQILLGLSQLAIQLKQEFSSHLIHGLYYVLESVGDSNDILQKTGHHVLDTFTKALSFQSVDEFVSKNVDYVVNEVSLKFRDIAKYPKAAQVLTAIIGVSGQKVIPLIHDIVESINDSLDVAYDLDNQVILSMMMALEALIKVISPGNSQVNPLISGNAVGNDSDGPVGKEILKLLEEWNQDLKEREDHERFLKETRTTEDVEAFFKDKIEAKEDAEDMYGQVDENSENSKPMTDSQQLVSSILERIKYLTSLDDPRLRFIILRIFTLSVPILTDQPSTLNPLIHQLWPKLMYRLQDKEHFNIYQTLLLISVLAKHAKDFVTRRVSEDVFPFLERISKTMKTFKNETNFKFKIEFKLLKAFLGCFETLISCLELPNKNKIQIPELLWPFLDEKQYPPEIVEITKRVFEKSAVQHSADATWFYLTAASGTHVIHPLSDFKEKFGLKELKFPSHLIPDTPIECDFESMKITDIHN